MDIERCEWGRATSAMRAMAAFAHGRAAGIDSARRATLRRILACVVAPALAVAPPVFARQQAQRAVLHPAVDLAADGAVSIRERRPILLFFDRGDCPYCERALREYVVPLSAEAPWRERAIFRQVEVDMPLPVTGFDGRATTHRALAAAYRVTLTPTIYVVDASGAPIANAVVGLTTIDFYGAYLDDALGAGWKRLNPGLNPGLLPAS
jgi:hypothetical protein